MERFKQFIVSLIIFSLSMNTFARVSLSEISDNSNPYTETSSNTTLSCTQMDEVPSQDKLCCQGLEKNLNTGKCDEPVYVDKALVGCNSNNDCSGGTGCFSQSSKDLFSRLSPAYTNDELNGEYQSLVSMQTHDIEAKAPGSLCAHARDCDSYSCLAGKCVEKKICRFADRGEIASAGIKCAEGMVRNASGRCDLSPEAKNPVYLGLLNEVVIEKAGQCNFKLDEETRKRSIIALKSIRAMEWMLATSSQDASDDCFGTIPLLKDEIGKSFHDTRKKIVNNFSARLNQIEDDFRKLIDAKEDSEKILVIHGDEKIAESNLATRQTSGYDSLMMMYRRNLLFQSYEESMLTTVKAANVKVTGLSEAMSGWQDGDTSWSLGSRVVQNYNCGAKYKKWRPFEWNTKYYSNTSNRWTSYYQITGNANKNADIIKKEEVALHLSLIGGISKEEAISEFTKSNYYLMDPMMFGQLDFENYGEEKSLGRTGFLGLGKRDLRKPRYLKGNASGSYARIYNDLKPKLREFYRNLNSDNSQSGFVYEPELLTTSAKDCLAPEKHNDPKLTQTEKEIRKSACSKFEAYLDSILDESFAQWLAYSASSNSNYTGYFENALTWRRKLLTKLEVDMQNISKYYETLISHRERQNECIEKVVNGLVDSGILATNSNGIVEGSLMVEGSKGTLSSTSSNTSLHSGRISKLTRPKFTFDLMSSSLSKINNKSMLDNLSGVGNTSDRAGVGSTSSAMLASRRQSMIKANDQAKSVGINITDKEKAVRDVMNGLTKNATSSMVAGAAPSFKGSRSSYGFPDKDLKNKTGILIVPEENEKNSDLDSKVSTIDLMPGQSGSDRRGEDFIIDGSHSKDKEAVSNPTGLSETDKERILAEYERTKKDYKTAEEDGIFNIVSKAYVRSLERILTRKKSID
jgi:hypothetical protein